jgi:hypothetical protein
MATKNHATLNPVVWAASNRRMELEIACPRQKRHLSKAAASSAHEPDGG